MPTRWRRTPRASGPTLLAALILLAATAAHGGDGTVEITARHDLGEPLAGVAWCRGELYALSASSGDVVRWTGEGRADRVVEVGRDYDEDSAPLGLLCDGDALGVLERDQVVWYDGDGVYRGTSLVAAGVQQAVRRGGTLITLRLAPGPVLARCNLDGATLANFGPQGPRGPGGGGASDGFFRALSWKLAAPAAADEHVTVYNAYDGEARRYGADGETLREGSLGFAPDTTGTDDGVLFRFVIAAAASDGAGGLYCLTYGAGRRTDRLTRHGADFRRTGTWRVPDEVEAGVSALAASSDGSLALANPRDGVVYVCRPPRPAGASATPRRESRQGAAEPDGAPSRR